MHSDKEQVQCYASQGAALGEGPNSLISAF